MKFTELYALVYTTSVVSAQIDYEIINKRRIPDLDASCGKYIIATVPRDENCSQGDSIIQYFNNIGMCNDKRNWMLYQMNHDDCSFCCGVDVVGAK